MDGGYREAEMDGQGGASFVVVMGAPTRQRSATWWTPAAPSGSR